MNLSRSSGVQLHPTSLPSGRLGPEAYAWVDWLAAAGQTIVLVEQNLAATLALAQRVYIINNGHIAHEGPADELKARPELLQRYLGV